MLWHKMRSYICFSVLPTRKKGPFTWTASDSVNYILDRCVVFVAMKVFSGEGND